eukprot:TRINITY_DN1061_c0_g1_i1.p1 TRINITY_DN1061_c0_g1~~TRINITY_DN1061_c0_g1_i1.p1  ORF type:complete len:74 (-),score=6.38 TRINITY_DN1061_c0_g1_i1:250-471(-)
MSIANRISLDCRTRRTWTFQPVEQLFSFVNCTTTTPNPMVVSSIFCRHYILQRMQMVLAQEGVNRNFHNGYTR